MPLFAHRVAAEAIAQFEEHGIVMAQEISRSQSRQSPAHHGDIDFLRRFWRRAAVEIIRDEMKGDGLVVEIIAKEPLGKGNSIDHHRGRV